MPAPQNYSNHSRIDRPFHLVLLPILLLNLGFSIYTTIHHWPEHPHLHPWWIVMSVALIQQAMLIRGYALKAQDRVIRLEERLRLAAILPASEHTLIPTLSARQLIALRFAADNELAALARRAAAEDLAPKAIKQSIVNWREDNHRI